MNEKKALKYHLTNDTCFLFVSGLDEIGHFEILTSKPIDKNCDEAIQLGANQNPGNPSSGPDSCLHNGID